MQALLIKIDQIEYAKTRAIIQAIVNKDEAQKALDEYKQFQFPYMEKIKQRDRDVHINRLQEEINKGPIQITPIEMKKTTSRLKTRVVERMTKEQKQALNRISKSLGRIM